jgi:hypothetical protein
MIGLLDVIVQSCNALDVRIDETFKDRSFGLVLESHFSRAVRVFRCSRRFRDVYLLFIDDGGTNVPTMLVLSSCILGDTFVSVHESVSLFVVAAVEDVTLEIRAVSDEVGRCLTWLSAGVAALLASTVTCL